MDSQLEEKFNKLEVKSPDSTSADGFVEEQQNDFSDFRKAAKIRSKQAAIEGQKESKGLDSDATRAVAWQNFSHDGKFPTENGLWVSHVELCDSKFTPEKLVIPKGTTVIFKVSDEELSMIEYQVVIKCQDVSPELRRGETYRFSFCETGIFQVKDTEFKGMTCEIHVVDHERADEMVDRVLCDLQKRKARRKSHSFESKDELPVNIPKNEDTMYTVAWGTEELTDEQDEAVQESLRLYYKKRDNR